MKSKLSDINNILVNCMNIVSTDIKLEKLIIELKSLQNKYAKQKPNPRGQPKDIREKRMYYVKRRRLNKVAKKIPNLTIGQEIELASLMIFLNKTCFNGLWRMNNNGEHNVPEGDYNAPTNICQESILRACNDYLKSATISTHPWNEALANIGPKDLVYLDPPYMPLEIDGNTFNNYFTDGFSKQDQIDLANLSAKIASKGTRVIASNHDALGEPTIREIYGDAAKKYGCRVFIQPIKVSRNISCKGHGRFKVNEVLIFMTK
jgi:DNA adenine methylase